MNRNSLNKYIVSAGALVSSILVANTVLSSESSVSDDVIAQQRAMLAKNTNGLGVGPHAPRDIDSLAGENSRYFAAAPAYTEMNLCNLHFHENAEHSGGEFTTYAGNGNGEGYGSGYKYNGSLTDAELTPLDEKIGVSEHGDLVPGDTIEVHYVYSSAQVTPGVTLGACLNETINNPQLRVEAQVFVLVNDESALDFVELTKVEKINGYYQAPGLPTDSGSPVEYAGSTTGPGYNETHSPFQVSWGVRPQVQKVNIKTVGAWLTSNIFEENHAHGVRNVVMNTDLLSKISP